MKDYNKVHQSKNDAEGNCTVSSKDKFRVDVRVSKLIKTGYWELVDMKLENDKYIATMKSLTPSTI